MIQSFLPVFSQLGSSHPHCGVPDTCVVLPPGQTILSFSIVNILSLLKTENNTLQDIVIETMLGWKNDEQGPLLLKLLALKQFLHLS